MGEQADYLINDGFMGCWVPTRSYRHKPVTYTELEYKFIIKETDKAWLLRMSGNAESWWPKCVCDIGDIGEKLITVPDWLIQQKIKNKKDNQEIPDSDLR